MSGPQVTHKAESFGEWVASRPSGQWVFRGFDSVLRLVEKTLMWSTQPAQPSCNSSESGTGTSLMIVPRPLPWPLFLPLLGFLGVLRVSVYYGTRILRKPLDTKDMIYWLQTKRRRLRAIKHAGRKNMQSQEDHVQQSTTKQTPASTPIRKTPSKEAAAVADGDSPDQEKKRKYCDVEQSDVTDDSDDEGVAVKLDKCIEDYDSENDPDYVVNDLSSDSSSEDEDVDSGEGEDEDDLKEDATPVKDDEAAPLDPAPEALLSAVPSIVTVEPVSEHGEANSESSGSGSLMSTSSFSVRAKSRLAKLFKSTSKTKQQL